MAVIGAVATLASDASGAVLVAGGAAAAAGCSTCCSRFRAGEVVWLGIAWRGDVFGIGVIVADGWVGDVVECWLAGATTGGPGCGKVRGGVTVAVALGSGMVANKAADISSPCGPTILPMMVNPSCVVSAVAGVPSASFMAQACISPIFMSGRTSGSVLEISVSMKGEVPVHPAKPSFQLYSSANAADADAKNSPLARMIPTRLADQGSTALRLYGCGRLCLEFV